MRLADPNHLGRALLLGDDRLNRTIFHITSAMRKGNLVPKLIELTKALAWSWIPMDERGFATYEHASMTTIHHLPNACSFLLTPSFQALRQS